MLKVTAFSALIAALMDTAMPAFAQEAKELAQSMVPTQFLMEATAVAPDLSWLEINSIAAEKFLAAGGSYVARSTTLARIVKEVVFTGGDRSDFRAEAVFADVASGVEIDVTNGRRGTQALILIKVHMPVGEDIDLAEAKTDAVVTHLSEVTPSSQSIEVDKSNHHVELSASRASIKVLVTGVYVPVQSQPVIMTAYLDNVLRRFVMNRRVLDTLGDDQRAERTVDAVRRGSVFNSQRSVERAGKK